MALRMSTVALLLFLGCAQPLTGSIGVSNSALKEESSAPIDVRERVNDASSTVSSAADVYRELIAEQRVASSLATESTCVAVFPEVITAAVGLGGIHGDGVAFCRDISGGWGNPLFLDLYGASVGLQAGLKKVHLVMFMRSPGAKAALQDEALELQGEFSALAGDLESKMTSPDQGIIVYGQAEGIFAGVSLNGVKLVVDKDEQRAFYGTYSRDSRWEGKIPDAVEASVAKLKGSLPN